MRNSRRYLLGTAAAICGLAVAGGALLASVRQPQRSAAVQLAAAGAVQSTDMVLTQDSTVNTEASEETTETDTESEAETADTEESRVYAINLSETAAVSEEGGEAEALSVYFEDKAIVNPELAANGLNIRSAEDESTDDNIVAQADTNDILTVESRDGAWTEVSSGSTRGYVKTEYLLFGNDAAETVKQSAEAYAQVSVSSMNIRMNPSTSSDILDTAVYGEAFPLISIENGWAKVSLGGGMTGYMAGNCVTLNYVWNGIIIASNVAGAADDEVIDSAAQTQAAEVDRPETEGQYLAMMASQTAAETAAASQSETVTSAAEQSASAESSETAAAASTAQDTGTAAQTEQTAASQTVTASEALSVTAIEAFYTGAPKTEGDVVSRSEISVTVRWSDGSFTTVTDGWESSDIGMILHAGTEVISVSYAGFTSNIELPVAAAETAAASTAAAAETTAAAAETTAAAAETTAAAPAETTAAAAETTAAAAETTAAATEAATTAATEAATTAATEAATTAATNTASVTNVTLSGELTYYTIQLCNQYGIDYSVVFSVMYQESRFNANAVAASGSGATGLMQIIPQYAAARMAKLGVTNLFDPAQNILVGVDMLAEYYYSTGSWTAALTMYRYGTTSGSSDYAQLILSRTSMFVLQ
ncbi:MAG: transglycosylase SLT domain-containing protein [Lachnospiraceae bacterium]|jgi:hypothetical protein